MHVETGLPVAKDPCKECPFRKTSAPGWLGGGVEGLAPNYMQMALSDANTPCHMSPGFFADDASRMRPCAGLAAFRANVIKQPRGGSALTAVLAVGKRSDVFATPGEFMDHHDTDLNRLLSEQAALVGSQSDA